jgi:hypothetical protein
LTGTQYDGHGPLKVLVVPGPPVLLVPVRKL